MQARKAASRGDEEGTRYAWKKYKIFAGIVAGGVMAFITLITAIISFYYELGI